MYTISDVFADRLATRNRTWLLKVNIDGTDYGPDTVIGFNIDASMIESNEFTIGTAIKSKLTLRMRTNEVIPPNARVVPYLAMSTDGITWDGADFAWDDADFAWAGGATDWLALGEFYVDNRVKSGSVWAYECYDRLAWADAAYISSLMYPASMQDVFDELCADLNYTYDGSVVIDPSYTIDLAPTGFTKRQMLGYIAGANSASIYIANDGTLKFKRYTAADAPVATFTPADYVRVRLTNPVKTYTRVVVTYDTEQQLTYEAGTGDADHTLQLANPFATQDIVDDLLASLNGLAYQPITMDARGYPQYEPGDVIAFTQQQSSSWLDTVSTWDETDVPWDGFVIYQTLMLRRSYAFQGGLKMSIESPSKSEQRSEFGTAGPITGRIDRLDQTAVKLTRRYYGTTISREEGIVIERDDHKSRARFNSDELRFQVGDGLGSYTDAIYFDTDDEVYKFTGVLEASSFVGGTIKIGSGTSVFKADSNGIYLGNETFGSAPFRVTPGGALTGTNVDLTGTINATGGTFSGSITASGTITGGTIRTAASGQRVELNSSDNLLRAVNSSGYTLSIQPDAGTSPGVVFSALSKLGLLLFDGTTFYVAGQLGAALQLVSEADLDIFASGAVNITAPGGLYVNGNLVAP